MRTTILAAVAALGLCLSTAAPANAQYYVQRYYYYPNTAYTYSYVNPGIYGYNPYVYGYSPNVYGYNPYAYSYSPGLGTQYYHWDWYNPYTNQYRTWRWIQRY